MLLAGGLLSTAGNWSSWSDRPFIVGHAEDDLSLVLSTEILSIAVLGSF
jgi:hypothetical protein